jgi:hypothetical protein
MSRTRRAAVIRLILLLFVASLFGLGDICSDGCNPTTGPQQVNWDSCKNPANLGSGITYDKCAGVAADKKCAAWAWDLQECYCCH